MAETPLFDQMSALLTYANGITGAGDTRLGDAVRSLADGYGGGGGLPSGIKYGEFTPTESTTAYTFEHGCGAIPKAVVVICDTILETNITGSMAMWNFLKIADTLSVSGNSARRNTSSGALSVATTVYGSMTDTSITLTTYNTAHFIRPYLHRWYAIY